MNRQTTVERLFGQIQSNLGLIALLMDETEPEVSPLFFKENYYKTGVVPQLSTVAQVNFSQMIKEVTLFYKNWCYEMEMRKI